ncbi:MAG: GMC family oxidoreductase [Polyangiaceae bacterium]|nr:GMC family oxidoreductase [Polyangiaceae bacterium]
MDAHPEASLPLPNPSQSSAAPEAPKRSSLLSARDRRVLTAIAEAAMPAGRVLEGAGPKTIDSLERWLDGMQPHVIKAIRAAAWAVELSPLPTRRALFSSLPVEARQAVLYEWEQHPSFAVRALLRAVLTPLKQVHFDRPEMFKHVDCRYELETVRDEQPRWMSQVINGREVEDDLEIECEVVVVGTGAGGAAAAYELASRGRAVLMIEEGDYHRRSAFQGPKTRAYKTMYRDNAVTIALGNAGIPVWAGRAVGGSTAVNSGTCYRTPDRTLNRWVKELGLPSDFSPAGLGPYFDRVESMLQVTPASPLHIGAIGPLIARGADRLGYSHGLLRRNAPGCDGQGLCCFGCPTGAKRSTDVSYVPEALKLGAQLITAARVDTVDMVAGRARGVTATLGGKRANGRRPVLKVKAEAVVVAGGALMTPLLLKRSGACQVSGMLGKNLSIHPASKVLALFDERVDQWKGIPQGYAIEQFAEEGLMFEGGSLPFDIAAASVPWTGPRFMELIEQYRQMATFGFMIQDESRGEVRPGIGRSPLVIYNLNAKDAAKMQRGVEILCEVFQAAGAKRVLPLAAGADEVSSKEDLARLRTRKIRPGDIEVTAFHPLGTCRIGMSPDDSCLGPDHEAHDVAGLFVVDGSAVPTSLGVNPQVTIMAMALRAAEIIDSRLS